jgi:DNA gyrase inhibitor GyrI
LGFYAWLGGFNSVKLSEQKTGVFQLLYLDHIGPYNKVYPVIQEVEKLVKDNHVDYQSTFGIYYDNPQHTNAEKLRSIVGVIVDDNALELAKKLIQDGKLKHRTIKEQYHIKTEFPYKNMLSMFIAIYRVYPAFNQYATEQKLPEMKKNSHDFEGNYIMEIYKNDKIEYLMTLPQKE